MSTPKLSKRLQRLCEEGGLRVADLACWFERPHNTVTGWVEGYREPRPAPRGMMGEILRRLRVLETLLDKGADLPIPHHLKANGRRAYVEQLRKFYVDRKVP